MKVKRSPVVMPPHVQDAEVPQGVDGTDAQLPQELPVPKAEVSAVLQAMTMGHVTATVQARPKAAWSARAVAIAAEVLAGLSASSKSAQVTEAFQVLLSRPELLAADVSCVVAGKDGVPLVDHQGARPTNPCSNAKLVTAAYALTVLGPGHRFRTTLGRTREGAVVVKGSFDPSLTRAAVDAVAKALKAKGITTVPRLLLDVSAMQGTNVPASFARYGDEDWEYLARPEPLSVDKNIVKLTVTPGQGEGADGVLTADTGAFSLRARIKTVGAKSEFKLGCNDADNGGVLERDGSGKAILDVWGTIAADYQKGKTLVMKSPAPLEQVAFSFRDAFERAGIAVSAVELGSAPDATPLHEHVSKPLGELLKTSLSSSNAFDHEMFALAAAHKEQGGPVSLRDAAARVTAFLRSLGGEGALVNGSGIGNESKVPAHALLRLLTAARTDARLHPILDALAAPGQTGTLKGRLLDTAAEGLFRGKTGTGEGAVALSGVAGDLAMSLLVEHMSSKRDDVRAVLDAAAIVLSSLARQG